MDTLQAVQQLLARELGLDPAALAPTTPLEQLGIDSLTVMECLFKIEDEFNISIANSNVTAGTVQDIADMVDRLIAAKATETS